MQSERPTIDLIYSQDWTVNKYILYHSYRSFDLLNYLGVARKGYFQLRCGSRVLPQPCMYGFVNAKSMVPTYNQIFQCAMCRKVDVCRFTSCSDQAPNSLAILYLSSCIFLFVMSW